MSDDTKRTIGGRPILWIDESGTLHRCSMAEVHPGIRLIWTDCQRDVPANQAFLPASDDASEACAQCKSPHPAPSGGEAQGEVG